jgi:hypothetical protein
MSALLAHKVQQVQLVLLVPLVLQVQLAQQVRQEFKA